MTDALLGLIVRAPGLSDQARVTLLEIGLHFGTGVIPSLNKLSTLRGAWKSTIQEHINELRNLGILIITENGTGGRRFQIDKDKLASLNGFLVYEDVTDVWLKSADAGIAQEVAQDDIWTINKPVQKYTEQDMLVYFKIAGKRHKASFVEKGNATTLRPIVKKFGSTLVVKMIDHFAMQHKHMRVVYSVKEFESKSKQIADTVIA